MKLDQLKVKKAIDEIEVPIDSLRAFTKTIPTLYEKENLSTGQGIEKRRKAPLALWKKRLLVSCSSVAAVGSILLSGFISPTMANVLERVPFIEKIYKDSPQFYGFSTAINQQMATQINETVSDNGVSMTINEALYDGIRLGLSYTIETKEEFEQISPSSSVKGGTKMSFNGYRPNNSGWTWDSKKISPNSYVGIQSIKVPGEVKEDKLSFSIHYTKLSDEKINGKVIKGNWSFKDIPVKRLPLITIQPNMKLETKNIRTVVKQVMVSPLTTSVIMEKTDNQSNDYMIFIKDEKGNMLEFRDSYSLETPGGSSTIQQDYETAFEKSSYLDIEVVNAHNKEDRAEIRVPIRK